MRINYIATNGHLSILATTWELLIFSVETFELFHPDDSSLLVDAKW